MKNVFIIVIIVSCLINCKIQEPIITNATIENGLEPGACYFTIFQENKIDGLIKEPPFIIEIIPLIYNQIEIDSSKVELKTINKSDGMYEYLVMPTQYEIIIKEENLDDYTIISNPTGYMYCLVEHSARYARITNEELVAMGNKVTTYDVSQSKMIKRYVKRKPDKLNENQYFFESGYWTIPKRAISTNF